MHCRGKFACHCAAKMLTDYEWYLLSVTKTTRSSAIAEAPRDALFQLKSC